YFDSSSQFLGANLLTMRIICIADKIVNNLFNNIDDKIVEFIGQCYNMVQEVLFRVPIKDIST
ncbi:MAG: hypothetical protein KC413_06250, partial [Anaerolineales bacterium]|nr:hypothetical protein [Anaerolineales bacterium]